MVILVFHIFCILRFKSYIFNIKFDTNENKQKNDESYSKKGLCPCITSRIPRWNILQGTCVSRRNKTQQELFFEEERHYSQKSVTGVIGVSPSMKPLTTLYALSQGFFY